MNRLNRPNRTKRFRHQAGMSKQSAMTFKGILLILILLSLLIGGGVYGWRRYAESKSGQANIITAPVTRGTFLHEVSGKGNAESAKNIDITCQVESAAGTTVIWIIPEGEIVNKGDELVLLDSSDLEDKVNTQQITCNSNAATVASSQASLRTAELSLEEYIEGTFEQNWMTIENSIYEAQENQKQAADTVRYTERLVQFGYTTVSQLEAEQVTEQRYLNSVRSNLLQQLVLLRYTSEKQITQLMASIETARAKLESDTYTNELAKSRLDHYKEQLEACTIKAPQAGQVVYANQDSRRWTSESDMIKEGSTVRERQVLIRLPDPNQMQVKTMINESNIAYVKDGMKATIAFDALSSRTFEGTVIKVNQYPEISWMSSAKDYVSIVKIEDSVPEIRSGLTAEVKIVSQEIPDVLMLPVQCIVEVGGRSYVIQYRDKIWSCKEVKLGLSNDKQVIIEAGLSEGDLVVSGARQYKDKVEFPLGKPSLYAEEEPVAKPGDAGKPGDESKHPEGGPAGPGAGGPGGMFANLMTDGKLELAKLPSEMPQAVLDQMKKADKNSDGFLDADELKALPKPGSRGGKGPGQGAPGAGGPGAGGMGGMPEAGPGMPGAGADKPEAVYPPEVKPLPSEEDNQAVLASLEPIKQYFDLTAMELCQRADEDNDKQITREEMQATFPEMVSFFNKWDRAGDGSLSRTDLVIGFCTSRITFNKLTSVKKTEETEEAPEGTEMLGLADKDPEELFGVMDVNQDEFLTEEEAPKENAEFFKNLIGKMDSNEDKKVSREEFIAGMKKIQKLTSGQEDKADKEDSGKAEAGQEADKAESGKTESGKAETDKVEAGKDESKESASAPESN